MGKAPEALRPADYLILEALSRRPMTIPEIARATQCSQPKIKERVARFEANNLVIRGKSNKLYAAMVVWVAPVAEVAEAISGQKVLIQHPDVPQMLEPEVSPTESGSERAGETRQRAKTAVPVVAPEKRAPEPYKPPAPPRGVEVSERAKAIAAKLRVPDYLDGWGEVGMGRVAKCALCSTKTTPLRYGTEVICPMCARGGR